MILGHQEILNRITGIETQQVENFFAIMSKHSLSELRLNTLKKLAELKSATIGAILSDLGQTTSGGTFISINSFFKSLEEEDILKSRMVGKTKYWAFSDRAKNLAIYLKV